MLPRQYNSVLMYWLGIDIGTGGSRALLINEDGQVTHGFTAPHDDIIMHRPLWAEQRPENWWDAAQAAIRGVLQAAAIDGSQIAAIGLSGQMHGLTLLDEANQVIRPALIWCDQRPQDQVDFVHATLGRANVVRWTANPVLTGFTLPKLLWVRDHEPENFARVRHVLLPKTSASASPANMPPKSPTPPAPRCSMSSTAAGRAR